MNYSLWTSAIFPILGSKQNFETSIPYDTAQSQLPIESYNAKIGRS